MGAIGGMLGLGGGASGTGFAAPAQAQLEQGVTTGQAINAYGGNEDALKQQQALVNALQGQNGIQNQSNVYSQLQDVANGTGPNPAQAMLNQQTGANVANQAALMAGQRGAGANVGLMARQAGQQGGALQQQAVGQGATMQANQSLGALGQMGQMAGQQVGNQIGATQNYTGAQQSEQGNLLNALAQLNSARVGSQSSVNSANAAMAQQKMKGQGDLLGGIGNALGSVGNIVGGIFGGGGGGDGNGGDVVAGSPAQGGYTGNIGPVAPGQGAYTNAQGPGYNHGGAVAAGPQSSFAQLLGGRMAGGGQVPVVLSPGEKVVYPENVEKAAGGNVQAKTVPGAARVSGDNKKNDTVKTSLPEGAVVIKRTKAGNDKDSASFVRSVLAKRGRK